MRERDGAARAQHTLALGSTFEGRLDVELREIGVERVALVSQHHEMTARRAAHEHQIFITAAMKGCVLHIVICQQIAANFFVAPDGQDAYLAAYFGAPPTAYQRARFVLARFANHLSYVAFLSLAAARAGVTAQPTPDDRAFHEGLIAGTLELTGADRKLQYANVHLAAARANIAALADAIAIVRDNVHAPSL